MNRTYEDMSKQELITLVKRLAKQHDEWSDKAEQMRKQAFELHHMICINIIENLTPRELFDKAEEVHDPYYKYRGGYSRKPLFRIGDW